MPVATRVLCFSYAPRGFSNPASAAFLLEQNAAACCWCVDSLCVSSSYAAYCSIWAKKRTVSPTQNVGVADERSETTGRDEARGRELSSCHSAVVADDAAKVSLLSSGILSKLT